ncbi:MAG: hypothetical protein GY765_35960 [bacterium]|nr:hypothetical protein [bacterium]
MRRFAFLKGFLLLCLVVFVCADAGLHSAQKEQGMDISVNPEIAAGKRISLPELINPKQIMVDDDNIYIADTHSVHIYARRDFKLKVKFGREGEGPKEFKQYLTIFSQDIKPDRLVISSMGKVSFYSRNGDFLREVKTPFGHWSFQPLGDQFIGSFLSGNAKEGFKALNIYDSKFQKIKEIYRKEFFFDETIKKRTLFVSNFRYWTHNKLIYVVAKEEFVIDRFDETGKKLTPVSMKYQRVKCLKEHRDGLINWMAGGTRQKAGYERLKKSLQFPEYFPAIRTIALSGPRIYVTAYERKEGKSRIFVFNPGGKCLKEFFFPIESPNGVTPYPFTFGKGKLYQLVESMEEEEWQLLILPIDN